MWFEELASRYEHLQQNKLRRDKRRRCMRAPYAPAHRRDDVLAELRVGQQKSPVFPLLGYVLRAPQVEVDGVALVLDVPRGSHHRVGVIAAELRDQRPVFLVIHAVEAPRTKLAWDSS